MPKKDRPITSIPTFDKKPEKVFKLWQDAGRIPKHYGSWDELEADFMSRLNDGMTKDQARKSMGVTYKSIADSYLLDTNTSKGVERGINRRAIREDLDPITERHVREKYGEATLDRFKEKLRNDWFKLAEAERLEMQGIAGKQYHRGHAYSALDGGSVAISNMLPEHGKRNSLHSSAPRWLRGIMEDVGLTQSYMEDFYEWHDLDRQGLHKGPRPSNALATAADEHQTSPAPGTRDGYWKNPEAGVDPASLEMRTDRAMQLESQGVSREAIDRYERNRSAALSIGDSTAQSGPVRSNSRHVTVQDTTPRPNGSLPPPRISVQPRAAELGIKPKPLSQVSKAAKGFTKLIPGPLDDLAIGTAVSGAVAGATLLSGGTPAQAGENFKETAVDFATGDLDGGSLANGELYAHQERVQKNPQYFGKQGPTVPTPKPTLPPNARTQPSTDSARLQVGSTKPPPAVQSAVNTVQKFIKDPNNELKWLKNQALGIFGIK